MDVDPERVRSFATPAEFGDWLAANHAVQPEIWVKMLKKASGEASVTWQEAVIEAIAWGWIDGLKKSNDDDLVVSAVHAAQARVRTGRNRTACSPKSSSPKAGMQPPGLGGL